MASVVALLKAILGAFFAACRPEASLVVENLALRQQLAVLRRAAGADGSSCNEDRPHMSLNGDVPVSRTVEPPSNGSVVVLSRVGGIHHRYSRAA
jgi:hypothetical protein